MDNKKLANATTESYAGGMQMTDFFDPIEYDTGTAIQTFNIIDTSVNSEGYEVLLDLELDSGYDLENVKMRISFEDMQAYDTEDIHEAVKYALGFFG
jgi:hypothetical protein